MQLKHYLAHRKMRDNHSYANLETYLSILSPCLFSTEMNTSKRLLILAGGASSRMKKNTENLAGVDSHLVDQANSLTKGMIGVGQGGKSLIDYLLFNAHLAGFTNVLLVLHPEDTVTQEYYEHLYKTNRAWNMTFQFARQFIAADRHKPAGTADALYQALYQNPDWQKGRFVVCNSDNLYSSTALNLLWDCIYPNALISYERDAMKFPQERINAFAIIKEDANSFLEEIIEKPTDDDTNVILRSQGRLGVSMNLFVMDAETMFPILEATPFHPVRNEKELPTAVSMYGQKFGRGFFTIPLSEHVPDLTSKTDLKVVQDYLSEHYKVTI